MESRRSVPQLLEEQCRDIFLGHSSFQKSFAEQLHRDLSTEDMSSFLAFSAMPETAKWQCRFFRPIRPALELCTIVNAQKFSNPDMAILPLFFKTSVKTVKEKLKNHDLLSKRAELHAEDDRINCEEWRDPLKEICKFNGMEYPEDRGEVIYRDRMVHHIRLLFPSNLKYDDSLVQGKTRSCKVADLLEWINGVKVVGLYGIAGSGKTTICKTLCKFYSRKFKAKVFHAEIDTDLQRRVEAEKRALKLLTAASDDLLGSLISEEQGSELLRARMPDHKVFVAIDSISHGSLSIRAAQSFLSAGFKEGSMIPLTARSRRMIKRLLREEESLLRHVPLLHDAEAMAILKLCDLTCAEIEVGKLCMRKCCFGGTCHPLALQAFGAYLFHKFGPHLLQWSEIPDFRDAKIKLEVALGWLAVALQRKQGPIVSAMLSTIWRRRVLWKKIV